MMETTDFGEINEMISEKGIIDIIKREHRRLIIKERVNEIGIFLENSTKAQVKCLCWAVQKIIDTNPDIKELIEYNMNINSLDEALEFLDLFFYETYMHKKYKKIKTYLLLNKSQKSKTMEDFDLYAFYSRLINKY